jgi:hypothetical protein
MGKNDLPEEKLARRKVNAEVRYGKRPHPNTLPCATCGHVWKEGERRHEYDHTLPLDKPENWTVVQAVCTTCHHGHTGERAEEDAVVTAVKRGPQATGERQSRIEYMPLASLKSHPRNPKDHDVPALVASIQRFGFNDAVIIDERTGQLVSGHGRVEALRAMAKEWDPRAHEPGSKALPSGILLQAGEWTVPVQRGYTSKDDTEAEAFIVAANRLVEAGGWDDTNLEAILADLAQANALDGTGFDMSEVERLINQPDVAGGGTDPMAEWQNMPEFHQPDARAFRSIIVHFKTQADIDAFAVLVGQKLGEKIRYMWFPEVPDVTFADKAYVAE